MGNLSLSDHSKLRKEELEKMSSSASFKDTPILSYLKDKMTIKNEKKIKIINR